MRGGGKDVLQDYSFNEYLKKYRKLGESGCFDYVPGDSNCAVWAAMQAVNGASMNLNNKEEYDKKYPEMLELRQKVADCYFKPGSENYKKHVTDKCWTIPDRFLEYLCNGSKIYYTVYLAKYNNGTPIVKFHGFENLLNGCPLAYLVNKNHYVNLSGNLETRKKFIPFLYDLWCCNWMFFSFFEKTHGILKNDAILLVLKHLFLDKDVKDVKCDEINKIMADFLKDVPHKYKPVLTFRLILFILDKYKTKVLDKLDFKLQADEFLTDVLVDLKKEVVDKDPKFSKKQEDKKNMQVDVDEIFKNFDIEIGNNISFKDRNFEYLDKLQDAIYDNDNYVIDVPRDDNCVFWSAMQAFEKRIIDKKADYQKMLDLRKKVAEFWKNKLGLSEHDEIYKSLISPETRVAPDLVYYYLCETNSIKSSFQIFPGSDYYVGQYLGRKPEEPGTAGIKFDNLKNNLFEIISGAPCCVLNNIHTKTLKDNHNLRKEIFIKLLDLDLALFFKMRVCNNNFNKNIFKRKLKFLFYFKEDKAQNFNDNFDSIINSVSDEFKTKKLCELFIFTYKKFKTEVLEKENKDITADEFYSSVFKEFKEKYIDNEFLSSGNVNLGAIFEKFGFEIGKDFNDKDKNYDRVSNENKDLFDNYTDDVPPDGNCNFYAAIQALEKRKVSIKSDYNKMLDLRKETAEWCKKKYNWDDNNKNLIALLSPGIHTNSNYVFEYLAHRYNIDVFNFTCYGAAGDFSHYGSKNEKNSYNLNLKDTFFSVIEGSCCIVGSKIHSRTLKFEPKLRKEFCLRYFDLYMISALSELHLELYNDIDDYKSVLYVFLFQLFHNEKKAFEEVEMRIDELIESIPNELKIIKLCEFTVFAYKKFKTEVLEKENKDITADEFYSSVLKEFKEKYIDNDPNLKQSKESEENKEEPSTDSKSKTKKDPDPELKINNEPENIPKDPDQKPIPVTDQTNQKPKTNEQSNNQEQLDKPKEDNKRDEIKTKVQILEKTIQRLEKALYIFMYYNAWYFFGIT